MAQAETKNQVAKAKAAKKKAAAGPRRIAPDYVLRAETLTVQALAAALELKTPEAATLLRRVAPEGWHKDADIPDRAATLAAAFSAVFDNPSAKDAQRLAVAQEVEHYLARYAEAGLAYDAKELDAYVAALNANLADFRRSTPRVAAQTEKSADELLSALCTDVRNAHRLRDAFGDDLYHHSGLGWMLYDGTRWLRDEKAVRLLAHSVGQLIRQEAANYTDPGIAGKLFKHAKFTETKRGIDSMLCEASVLTGIDADRLKFDEDVWLLNCPNGTVDLRTGRMKPHDRADLITKLCPTLYNPEAIDGPWVTALDTIFDGDRGVLDYFQWLCGYSLSGSTMHHVFAILHGGGCNGKSTVIEVLQKTIGEDYAQALDPEQLMQQPFQGHPTAVAALRGCRFLSAVETTEGGRLNTARIKGWTGGDRIRARFMRMDEIEFRPHFKLFLATNHKPEIRDDSGGMWRRVRLIPFNHDFLTDPHCDNNIGQKLLDFAEGILAWAVRGAVEAAIDEPALPQAVRAATESYRTESDTISAFIEECCELNEHATVSKSSLYAAYKGFMGGRCESKKAFGTRIMDKGITDYSARTAGRKWKGIMLTGNDLRDSEG